MWEGYYIEEEHQKTWLAGAQKLRMINPQVLEDIEDHIILEGFKGQKDIKSIPADIDAKIKANL